MEKENLDVTENKDVQQPAEDAVVRDIKAYFEQCCENLRQPDSPGRAYLKDRGISVEAALHAGIGCDPEWKKSTNATPFPAMIAPLGPESYEISSIQRPVAEGPMWRQRGPFIPWNWGALEHGGVTFIVSGILDGLAVMEAGYKASAILGARNGPQYVKTLEAAGWTPPEDAAYVIAFTRSPYDEDAAKFIGGWLQASGAAVVQATDLAGDTLQRLFEAHRDDPEAFKAAVQKTAEQAAETAKEAGHTVDAAPTDVPHEWPGVYVSEERALPRIKSMQQIPNSEKRTIRRKALREAGADVVKRFEECGIKVQTAIDSGLGYVPDRTQDDGPLFIMVPYGRRQSVNIPWGVPLKDEVYKRIQAYLWNQRVLRNKGVIVITRDVPDALAAIESGMTAAALINGNPERFIQHIADEKTKFHPLTAFVIALGAGEEDQKNADAIVQALKEKKALVAKAPVSGHSASIIEEYRKSPETVKKRFAVVKERCEAPLAKRKEILAKQKQQRKGGGKKKKFKKNNFKPRRQGGGRPPQGGGRSPQGGGRPQRSDGRPPQNRTPKA